MLLSISYQLVTISVTPLWGFKGFTVSAVCGYVCFVYVIFVLFRAMKKKYNTAAADIQRMSHDLEASTRHADVSATIIGVICFYPFWMVL